tara:strand:- start:846 stop:1730 length:885 start_codon:yes stop_codon:yes gene_type:complete
MKVAIFPGQGAQFPGMGKHLYDTNKKAKNHFEKANKLLGFSITDIMFGKDAEALQHTKVTQPAIFLHSTILFETANKIWMPDMVAGHSLGEFSALVAAKVLSFEDGLQLVYKRALAMQEACEKTNGSMAAVLGLEDEVVVQHCNQTDAVVIPANFNCPGQLVISGSIDGVNKVSLALKGAGAKRLVPLSVSGAFHSPLMEHAQNKLADAIEITRFNPPECPIYQNVSALPTKDPALIKKQLIAQLTAPVKWAQSVSQMIENGAEEFVEVGPGKVLQGLIRKINREVQTISFEDI